MKLVRESIFSSAVRSFCIAFFSVIGIMIAVFLVLLVFGAGKNTKAVDISTFEAIIPDTNGRKYNYHSNKPLILRIDITGVIGQSQQATIENVRSILNESRLGPLKNDKIKAILIYMNSPGGGAIASDSIYYAIKDYALKYQIPVYTYVEGLCASGGFYIACASDKIYASNSSMIGSVGTYMMFFNVTGTMSKYGVENWTIARGTDKTAMSPFQPWNESSDAPYLPLLDATYNQFITIVANSRPKVTKNQLINTYGAHVFMADEAEKIGYIDGSGYQLNEVTQMLAKEAKIEDSYQVISLEPKAKLTDLFKLDNFSSKANLMKTLNPTFPSKEELSKLEPQLLYTAPISE